MTKGTDLAGFSAEWRSLTTYDLAILRDARLRRTASPKDKI